MRCWLWLLALAPVLAGAQQATCPDVLAEGSTSIIRAPAGWTPSTGLARLSSAGMMSGPPGTLAYLVPASTVSGKNQSIDTWAFRAGDEKWLWCGYGGESLQLAKRMDDKATECKLTGERDKHRHLQRISVACK